jgi:hypothetical protein
MKRHRIDPISAGFGVLCVWVGIGELVPELSIPAAVVWPIVAVAGGVTLLVSALRREYEGADSSPLTTDLPQDGSL